MNPPSSKMTGKYNINLFTLLTVGGDVHLETYTHIYTEDGEVCLKTYTALSFACAVLVPHHIPLLFTHVEVL